MSNKPNFKRVVQFKEKDVLVNYCIMKASDKPADVEKALKAVVQHVMNHPVYYNVEPTMFENEILFSLIGFPRDQKVFLQEMYIELKDHNCVMRNSKYFPVPITKSSSMAMPKI